MAEYRTVNDLTEDELQELKDRFWYWYGEDNDYIYDEITEDFIKEWYSGTSFVSDDFFCNQKET